MVQSQSILQPDIYQSEHILSEKERAQQILAGDRDAFAFFVQKYSSPLYNYMYRVLHDADIAADMLQNVFIRFYNYLPRLNLERPFKPWLFQVAHNCCVDELRNQHRHMAQPFSTLQDEESNLESFVSIEDMHANTEEICERHDLQSSLWRAIMILPQRTREVVILRYTSNMTFSQISDVLQMPEQTAKTYFCRARKVLRQELEKEGIFGARH